jgi:hypothetical protein
VSFHIVKSNALFLHIPKTGGTWIEQASTSAGIEIVSAPALSNVTWRHSLLNQYLNRYEFVFAFVRHPLTWYESWWKFQTWLNWRDHEPNVWHPQNVLKPCASNDFDEFIRLCIKHEPAYVTRLYEWYLGPEGAEFVSFIGRYEHLADDLVKVYRSLSLEFDEPALRAQAPANVSLVEPPAWDKELKARMLEMETPAIRRFYF